MRKLTLDGLLINGINEYYKGKIMFSNLLKAAINVAVSPIALVVDIVNLPSSAYNDTEPFQCTSTVLTNAGECFVDAVTD